MRSSAPSWGSPSSPKSRASRTSLTANPLLPVASSTRSLSIRSPVGTPPSAFARFHYSNANTRLRSRRFGLGVLVVSVLAVLWWRRPKEETMADGGATAAEDERCRSFPWLAGCEGKTATARDPFDDLHFERQGGYLFYPAHATTDESAAPAGQPHPIHMLMDEAARAWAKKASSQSKTLRDAVAEYERRYQMRPPKGFAEWFAFAQANSFVLVDEFDSLHRKVLPYLALPSRLLRQRSEKLQNDEKFWLQDKTFTIEIKDGKGKARGPMSGSGNKRDRQMLLLLKGIMGKLGDVNVTFTGHDQPWIGLSGEARAEMIAKAKAGEYLDEAKFDDYQDNWDYDGWAAICPPESAIRLAKRFEERAEDWTPPSNASFIHDHVAAMDLCAHPERQGLHGSIAWPGPRPGLLFPIFSFTSTTIHSDFLAPPIDQYDFSVGDDPDWEDKPHAKVVWRGTTTGADLNAPHMRKFSQRPRLCALMRQPGRLTLPIAPFDTPNQLGPTEVFTSPAQSIAASYFDFKFLGEPQQCADPVPCAEFKSEHSWDTFMPNTEQNKYKFVIDVDGNGWSGRFHRLMSSKVMVLKSTIFPEWYADHIQPWLHYVPVSTDYTDLWPIMAFFKGNKNGEGAHDELAKKIALEGKDWAEHHWRWEDMQVYFYRLLIEYERIMNRDDDPRSWDM